MPRYFFKICLFTPLFFFYTTFAFAEHEISTRIVGGQESQQQEWPWVVSLKSAASEDHFCGASLIANKWILTAAHCVIYNGRVFSPLQLSVTVGEYDITSNSPILAIEQIYVHPDFNRESQLNDVALLKLVEPVEDVPILEIGNSQLANNAIANQHDISVLGWGSTTAYLSEQSLAPQSPNILHHVEMPLMTDAMCTNNLAEKYHSPEMLCAGLIEGGKDSCQGDSGGPLVINEGGIWQQLGIVSWGFGCAAPGYPGVYTRVSTYGEWINNVTQGINSTNKVEYIDTIVNNSSIKTIEISNNSNTDANLRITQSGSNAFNFANTDCTFISANDSCDLMVTYQPRDSIIAEGIITINSDLPDAPLLYTTLVGLPLIHATEMVANTDFDTDTISWFTGGFSHWNVAESNNNLQSGIIVDNQKSILKAQLSGTGRLSFDWAVDSERNYDWLTLIINEEVIDSISASKDLQTMQVFISKQQTDVLWVYEKDQSESTGADQAYLHNLTFTPMSRDEYDQLKENNDNVDAADSSSGGSLDWVSLLFLLPLIMIRRYI